MLEKLRYDGLEHGGAIGADANGMVTHVFPDIASHLESYSYTPSGEVAKAIQKWVDEGISAIGFVHSHPNDKRNQLTQGDIHFGVEFLKMNPAFQSLTMGIICDDALTLYQVDANASVSELKLNLV